MVCKINSFIVICSRSEHIFSELFLKEHLRLDTYIYIADYIKTKKRKGLK
jgi:hypothetical protein